MAKRVAALLMTGDEMQGLGFDLSEAHELAMWDDEHRFQTRCELDAAFFNLYGLDGHDVEYILDTFPIVKEHGKVAREKAARAKQRVRYGVGICSCDNNFYASMNDTFGYFLTVSCESYQSLNIKYNQ